MAPVQLGLVTRRERLTVQSLAEAVKEHPCLYYSEHPSFKNFSLKRQLWKQIGARFGISGSLCQKKFKNAKDTYARVRNALQKARDGKNERKPSKVWQHFDMMHELLTAHMDETQLAELDVPTADADDSESIQSCGSITISYEGDEPSDEKPAVTQRPETTSNGVVTPTNTTEAANQDLQSVETTMANSMATCIEHLKMLHDQRKESCFQRDKVYHFCMYVAGCIRELNKKEQMEAMRDIYAVINKYQQKQLENT